MVYLYINGQLVDIGNDLNINLTKEFEQDDFEVREATYSYEFSIPTTINNKRIFGYGDAFDTPSKFDRVYKAQLYADESLILDGNIILQEITSTEYRVNIYKPSKKALKDILGDLRLNEIKPHYKGINKFQDINTINDYVMNYTLGASLPSSTDEYLKYQYDNHICFPYCLYSYPYNRKTTTYGKYTQDCSLSGNTFGMDNIFPSFNVLSVLKDIFETKDLKIDGNIFKNRIFTDLYQTYQGNADDYVKNKDASYFVEYKVGYQSLKNGNVSSTLALSNVFETELCGFDAPLLSENSKVDIISNDFGMLAKGDNGGYAVTVPKDGWYQIHIDGTWDYISHESGYIYDVNGRTKIGGMYSSRGNGTLRHHPFEIQVKKGTPLNNTNLYGLINSIPSIPSDYQSEVSVKCWGGSNIGNVYMLTQQKEEQARYPKNNKTMLINDYSGYDTSNFICGARFGRTNNSSIEFVKFEGGYNHNYGDNVLDEHTVMCCLPKPQRQIMDFYADYIKLYDFNVGTYNGEKTGTTYCYDWDSAQAMVKADSFSNFEGYNVFNNKANTWNTSSNPLKREYSGQKNNSARSRSVSGGTFDVNTCVWLEKGDVIGVEVMSSAYWWANNYKKWNEKWDKVVTDNKCSYTFSMGFVSDDKEYVPNDEQPIPTKQQMMGNKVTNVNLLLPNISANDFLENFLETFNLKIAKVGENSYTIDYINSYSSNGKIVNLDGYSHVSLAKHSRLDIPSEFALKFKTDTKEAGYVEGNLNCSGDTNFYVPPKYDGSKRYLNPSNTSDEVKEVESDYSYNWYLKIDAVNTPRGNKTVYAPYIMDDSVFITDNYEAVQKKGFKTDSTPRLFYISSEGQTITDNLLEFYYNEQNDTCRLLQARNYKLLGNGQYSKRFYLDYNDANKTTENLYLNLQKKFFNNVTLSTAYQISLPCVLPNHLFGIVNENTMFMFNDGIYRIKSIEGHSINEYANSTVTLQTL